jgi:pseudouridine-5'-monophosphatase
MSEDKFRHADHRLLSLEAFDLKAWGCPTTPGTLRHGRP